MENMQKSPEIRQLNSKTAQASSESQSGYSVSQVTSTKYLRFQKTATGVTYAIWKNKDGSPAGSARYTKSLAVLNTMNMLSVNDISKDLGVCEQTVKRLIKRGKLKASLANNRVGYRISVKDYNEFLDKNPNYSNLRNGRELGIKVEFTKDLLVGMYQLQKEFLLEEHGKVYSEGWNNAMEQFDKLVKTTIVDRI